MVRARDIRAVAQAFADELALMLNRTVASNVALTAAQKTRDIAAFGTYNRKDLNRPTGIPLHPRKPHARVYLDFGFELYLDEDNYLTVLQSVFAVRAGAEGEHLLFHYDYQREKAEYPDAHLQVCMDGQPFTELFAALERPRERISRLHFPVGGKRYRPALEDVIEFLVREELVAERPSVYAVLEESRRQFRRKQLMAAIRRDPETAADALVGEGYHVVPPIRKTIKAAVKRAGRKR